MRDKVLVVLIVVLAIVFRFWNIDTNPVSLNWDEAAWGYNAYALGIDGRDEFGVLLPYKYLESFGDFKPPLYAYLSVLPVKVFGLSEFSTRFASAFFGSLTILVSYYLVRRLFYSSRSKEYYALFTAFFLAISPWHIMLSRAAFEANIVTFLLVLAVWLFLKGIQDRSYFLILSVVPFALSFYTFNSARIVTPLLVLLLCVTFLRLLMTKRLKEIVIAGILGLLFMAPLLSFLLSPQASLRFKEVNIFTDISVISRSNQEIVNDNNAVWSKILHHRLLGYSTEFVSHYFDHFNPDFLFISGDFNPKFSTQDVGQLYLFEIPFFIAGLVLLVRKKEGYWWIVPFWIIIGIIPAAVARETPHALRIGSTVPMFQVLISIGVTWFILYLKKMNKIVAMSVGFLLILSVVLQSVYFFHGYYNHYPREYAEDWQYGYKESIAYVADNITKYDEVHITGYLGRPYIYYLFYTKFNPATYRKIVKFDRDTFGFVHVSHFGKFYFPERIVVETNSNKKILYITSKNEIPVNAKILKQFYLLNGTVQLVASTL